MSKMYKAIIALFCLGILTSVPAHASKKKCKEGLTAIYQEARDGVAGLTGDCREVALHGYSVDEDTFWACYRSSAGGTLVPLMTQLNKKRKKVCANFCRAFATAACSNDDARALANGLPGFEALLQAIGFSPMDEMDSSDAVYRPGENDPYIENGNGDYSSDSPSEISI